MMVGIVDYDAGNIRSVERALAHLNADCLRSADPEALLKTDKLVFPGVGEAFSAIEALKKTGLDRCIRDFAAMGKPILGICLGCQIILDFSEERDTGCLSLVPGKASKFSTTMGLKIPHMGWNQVKQVSKHPLFTDIPDCASFYFVHSYFPVPGPDAAILGTTTYGIEFASVFAKDNIYACQFHPEKSGPFGIKLLKNFLSM